MKKLLLFAVAALIASTVSAQSLGTKPTGKPVQQSRFAALNQAKKMMPPTVMPMKATISRDEAQPRTAKATTLNVSKLQGAKATGRLKLSAAPRKASSALASYVGTCSDNKGEAQVWTMVPCTVIDDLGLESPGFQDMVPNPFTAAGVENIYVYYFDLDGTLIVPAQPVTSLTFNDGSENSIWITNYSSDSEDGSIPLTLEGDGTLKMETDYVAYVGLPVDATEFSFDDMEWYWSYYKNIKYQDPDNIPTPEPCYTYDDLVLFSGISASGYSFSYQHIMTPAYAPVRATNYTLDLTDAWDWKTYALTWDETAGEDGDGAYVKGEVLASGTEKAFSYVTDPDYLYAPVELVAAYGENVSDPYLDADEDGLVYAGAIGHNWKFNEIDEAPLLSRSNIKYDIHYYRGMGTEDGIHSFILYQGKPTAPFYFEGVKALLAEFNAEENFNLKCKIQKVDRSTGKLVLGEVVAESEVDPNSIFTSDWGATEIQWNNFQAEDEMGFKSDLDYIFIEDEFAIIIEGWDNGSFSGYFLADGGANAGRTSTLVVASDEEEFSGLGFQTFYGHLMVGFTGGVYGYLHTEDATDLVIPAKGGEASIHVNPMLISSDEEGNPSARIFIESIVENEEELEEVPEWLSLGIANEDYTTDEDGYVIDPSFDLVAKAEALPAGVESRSCEIVFMQEGALLKVTVTQGQGESECVTKINVEREVGMGYGVTSYEPDFTEALAYLGIEKPTDATLVGINADGSEEAAPGPGGIDGWCDADGNFVGWHQGGDSRICVKFFPSVPQYEICDMNGADEVGKTYTVKYGLKANDKMAVFAINVTFVESQEVELSLSENVIKARVEYNSDDVSYIEKMVELTDEQVNSILAELGLASLSEAAVYGWNPTTEEFVKNYEAYDGWRNAQGDFANWSGNATVPACVKYTDGKTYPCYNIQGCEPQEIKCYWAIANDKRAVLVEITFAYLASTGIEEMKADNQADAIFNINGVRMQNAQQKGVFIQNGKKIVKK